VEPGLPSDRAGLEALFGELANEVAAPGTSAEVVMVGGSWMLWHAQRASTRDVDSGRRFGTDVTEAVDRRVECRQVALDQPHEPHRS